MASKRIQKWIEDGEEVKTNLAALIDSPLLVNSESQPELGDTTDGCTAGTSKRARKLTAVMQESQEQQKSDSENRADKPEKAPAKKRKKDDKETDHIDSQKSNKENKGKQAKKGPVKSKADKSKETRKQLSNIANKTTAENEACTKATREIYQTFMAAFPGSTHPKERGNQVSLVEDSEDSDAEEETDGTAGELANVPSSLGEPTVTPPRIQQQMSASISLPHQVQVTPPIATDSRQELLPPIQSGSFTPRSGTTLSLSETAEAFVRAMNSPLNVDSDEDFFPPGGFRDFLARPLGQDMSQESQKELAQLREENSQLRDEIAMLREQLNSSAKNQPVPSAEVLLYMRDILAANTSDGTELLPELPDVAIQDYTIRVNLEPRPSQAPHDTVKLLEKSDVFVNRNALRSIVQSGHAKGALHLLKKLIPLVFSTSSNK